MGVVERIYKTITHSILSLKQADLKSSPTTLVKGLQWIINELIAFIQCKFIIGIDIVKLKTAKNIEKKSSQVVWPDCIETLLLCKIFLGESSSGSSPDLEPTLTWTVPESLYDLFWPTFNFFDLYFFTTILCILIVLRWECSKRGLINQQNFQYNQFF